MDIFKGILLVLVGFGIVWKTRKIVDFFGSIPWADAKLGGGGTTIMYKVIGIIFILVGFFYATGLWYAFLDWTLGSIFPKGLI
jgi:hypothetical protein